MKQTTYHCGVCDQDTLDPAHGYMCPYCGHTLTELTPNTTMTILDYKEIYLTTSEEIF